MEGYKSKEIDPKNIDWMKSVDEFFKVIDYFNDFYNGKINHLDLDLLNGLYSNEIYKLIEDELSKTNNKEEKELFYKFIEGVKTHMEDILTSLHKEKINDVMLFKNQLSDNIVNILEGVAKKENLGKIEVDSLSKTLDMWLLLEQFRAIVFKLKSKHKSK